MLVSPVCANASSSSTSEGDQCEGDQSLVGALPSLSAPHPAPELMEGQSSVIALGSLSAQVTRLTKRSSHGPHSSLTRDAQQATTDAAGSKPAHRSSTTSRALAWMGHWFRPLKPRTEAQEPQPRQASGQALPLFRHGRRWSRRFWRLKHKRNDALSQLDLQRANINDHSMDHSRASTAKLGHQCFPFIPQSDGKPMSERAVQNIGLLRWKAAPATPRPDKLAWTVHGGDDFKSLSLAVMTQQGTFSSPLSDRSV